MEEDEEDELLEKKGASGAIVLMTLSGEILALATAPRYTLKELRKDYTRLATSPKGYLFDRAVMNRIIPPPGSLFKVVTTAAALEEGIVSPEQTYTKKREKTGG